MGHGEAREASEAGLGVNAAAPLLLATSRSRRRCAVATRTPQGARGRDAILTPGFGISPRLQHHLQWKSPRGRTVGEADALPEHQQRVPTTRATRAFAGLRPTRSLSVPTSR